MGHPISRRDTLRHLFVFAAGSPLLLACNKELSCTDTSGLSSDEMAMRNTVNYLDKSPDPAKLCSACQLYLPAAADVCGGCTVVKGPINPAGTCSSWVQRQG